MTPEAALLEIRLFGIPTVRADGAVVVFDTRKATALLSYLILSGPQSRDRLATLLWPDYDTDRARAALRRTLSTLRAGVGKRAIRADRTRIEIDPAVWSSDVQAFRELSSSGELAALERAAALASSDFMAGFGLRDSAEFDEWQRSEADRLKMEVGRLLEKLTAEYHSRGRYADAVAPAQRRVELDPLHEPAHRALMTSLAGAGHVSAAHDQYRQCVMILDRELGVAPLQETTELYEAIMADRLIDKPAPPAPPAPSAASSHVASADLVGRSAERAKLIERFEASTVSGQVVAIAGEAGVGKTALAMDLLEVARTRGASTFTMRAYEGEAGLAYGPVVDALDLLMKTPEHDLFATVSPETLREVSRLIPGLSGDDVPAASAGSGAEARFLRALSDVVAAAAGSGHYPAIVFLDDAQWADQATLDLIGFTARRVTKQRLMLLLTWRDEDTQPVQQLQRVLGLAEREGFGLEISLQRLDAAGVRALAERAGVREDVATGLWERTLGLPFFVVQYLEAMSADAEATELPHGIRRLLQARTAHLSEVSAQVLAAASVIGRPFDPDLLRSVSGRSEDETLDAVEELGGRRLIAPSDENHYAFTHETLRGFVYDRLSLSRRRLLHRRAADSIGTSDPALSANHFLLAGKEADAAQRFAIAGNHARAVFANAEAVAHFERALALGHPEAASILEAVGDLRTLLGDYGAALRSYESAASTAGESSALEQKIANLYLRRGQFDLAESHLSRAEELIDNEDPAILGRLHADRSLVAHHRGRTEEARALSSSALTQAEEAGDHRGHAQARNILGMIAREGGDAEEAAAHLREALAVAQQAGDEPMQVAALNNLALSLRTAGEIEAAIGFTRQALTICSKLGDRHREAALHSNLADLLHGSGNSDAAMEHLKQAAALFREVGEEGVMEPEIWKLVEW